MRQILKFLIPMLIVGAFIGQDVDAKSGRRAKKRIALTTF